MPSNRGDEGLLINHKATGLDWGLEVVRGELELGSRELGVRNALERAWHSGKCDRHARTLHSKAPV